MNKGVILYEKAKKIIPGGTMLLSKRPEMFLPEKWPSYFSKTKGCKVWDLDKVKYTDMSIMGIGTNTLGYNNKIVDQAVINTIKKGNMSTLNCPEEVKLAEKLIELNPWGGMVRFARTGGEANAISIRIARAASGKDNVAICGYHGWHDWYLSANHNNENELASHLISGLTPNGVPHNLKNSVFPFEYNNYDELEYLVKNKNIGVIKMEVIRNFEPTNNFLEKVRNLATTNNIVLIFDECTSGFRETFGGIYKKYNIEPDIAIYGKTIGNGYALTAVVGKEEIMQSAQKTFISSTFWTERIGPTAALATLTEMEKISSWEIITEKGNYMRKGWIDLSKKHQLSININGIPALSTYNFKHEDNLKFKTYITQEMLKNNILGSTSFYASTEHKKKDFEKYFDVLDSIYYKINKCVKNEIIIDELLESPVCHSGFKRLN